MSLILKKLSGEIFNILKGHGRSLTLYGENGNVVYDPEDAVRMYVLPDKMMLSIIQDDNDIEVKLYIGKSIEIKNIEEIIKTIRAVCSRLNCLFNIRRYGKDIVPKDFAYQIKTNESLSEAYYNSLKTTYENIGNCKLILKHTKNVDEDIRGSSSRNIKTMYVQTDKKEKILLPTINLNAGRAIARHLSNGGKIYDSVGEYVVETAKEFHILKNIIKNIHKIKKDIIKPSDKHKKTLNIKTIKNVSPDQYVSSISESIRKRLNEIRSTFKIISGSRNYKKYHDFISTKNKYESSIISNEDNEHLVEFFSENNLDLNDIEYVANVVGMKTSELPMFIVDDEIILELSTIYKRRFKYGIDYIISENTIIFFNPDCFSEILSYLETNNKQFEIVSNEKLDMPCDITITSDSISDIVEILHNELGYTTEYYVDGDNIHFKESEVYENVVPLLNISNIKFKSKKLNSTCEDKNMAETSNKVLNFAEKWISENGADSDPSRLANELSNFMDGSIVPEIEKEDKREFEDHNSELSYKVRIVSDALDDESLSTFLTIVSDKLRDDATMTKPEKQIAEKAVKIYDDAQNKTVEDVKPKSRSEFSELEEWFKKFNPDIVEDENVTTDTDTDTDADKITIRLIDDNATLSTLNKIAELTETNVSDIVSDKEVTFTGTKYECDSVVDELTSIMNQNGDLGSIEISGPQTSSEQIASDTVNDLMTSESLTESDIPELERLLSIVESDEELTAKYIENDGNFNVVNEQTGICFHTVKGNRKIADYYVESFNNENVKQQKKLLKSIIGSLIEEAKTPTTVVDTIIDEQYISELKDCLAETENANEVSFRVIEHDGSYAVVNEQTGIIVNQYSDNTVAQKTAENYNENKEASKKHLKSIIEMALSEAEKDNDNSDEECETDDKEPEEFVEAMTYAESINLDKTIRNNVSAQGSKKLTNLDKFNIVTNIAEHLFSETIKQEEFSNIGLNEENFVSLAESIFDKNIIPVLKNKNLISEDAETEDAKNPDDKSKIDFSELKKKADKLKVDDADFDVVEKDGMFHVIEKSFPDVCLGEYSSEDKARTKAADYISEPKSGIEELRKNINDEILDDDLNEDVSNLDEDGDFNQLLDQAAESINIDEMLASGDFDEPCVVNPHLENVFCARIAQKMYDYVVSNGGNENSTITPNNFMGPASFILAKNIDKFKQAGFEFDSNSAYNEEEEETIPTNDQATFKDEISSDVVTNPEQDNMDSLRKLAGLEK